MNTRYWSDVVEGRRGGVIASLLRCVLRLLSLHYRLVVAARKAAYDRGLMRSRRLPRPAVSVGNLVAGGVGKTPFVQFLAASLQGRGMRVAIVSRGYGGRARRKPLLVSDGKRLLLTAEQGGDEPVMLAAALPGAVVAADPARRRAARMAADRFDIDVFILDDAFQHRRAAREADLLLLDAERPFGNGRLLPAGHLREPSGNIARADLIVLTRCASPPPTDLVTTLRRINPRAPIFAAHHRAVRVREIASGEGRGVQSLAGKRVAAFSGVARPEDFEASLAGSGARIVSRRSFPDHHRYTPEEIDGVFAEAERCGAEAVVTTAKDAVRLPEAGGRTLPLLCLEIEMEICGDGGELIECVVGLLRRKRSSAPDQPGGSACRDVQT